MCVLYKLGKGAPIEYAIVTRRDPGCAHVMFVAHACHFGEIALLLRLAHITFLKFPLAHPCDLPVVRRVVGAWWMVPIPFVGRCWS